MSATKADEKTMPMQVHTHPRNGEVPTPVAMLAYEVYCHCYGEQKALIEGGCRGGFGVGEILAFLYARSFPKSEWRTRADEALRGLRT